MGLPPCPPHILSLAIFLATMSGSLLADLRLTQPVAMRRAVNGMQKLLLKPKRGYEAAVLLGCLQKRGKSAVTHTGIFASPKLRVGLERRVFSGRFQQHPTLPPFYTSISRGLDP